MSLVVSLRVPDGIVVAADSLSTAHSILQVVGKDVEITCPSCNRAFSAKDMKFPQIPIPFSASSYTQKLFSLYDKFAVASFGLGIINNRSIYNHIHLFQNDHKDLSELGEIKDALISYFEHALSSQYPKYKEEAPKDWLPIGFHLNGYEEVEGQKVNATYEVYIGAKNVIYRRDKIGCVVGGDMKVVQKLWDIGKENPMLKFKYGLFSLQDAIDFSEFLIHVTGTFQRFANEVATVGGNIDIALLTPFRGFQWIRRKKLMEILEE